MSALHGPEHEKAGPPREWLRADREVHAWEVKLRVYLFTRVNEVGCWEWRGAVAKSGYGVFTWRHGGPQQAHRTVYEEIVGPVPKGLTLDHLCRNRRCVRPDHLEAVTPRENSLRMWAARRMRQ